MALNAFKLTSLPFFPAIVLKLSNARVLCIGLDCARSVSAESLSESVPDARTFAINCSSDLEVEGGGGKAECSSSALLQTEDSSDCIGASRFGVGRRGGKSTAYHRALAGMFFKTF